MEEVPWYVSLFVSWLPFILFVLALWWFTRAASRRMENALRTPDGRSLAQVLEQHTRETRRTNELLEQMTKERGAAGR